MSTQNLYNVMELVDQKEGISRKILFFYHKEKKKKAILKSGCT